MDETGLTRNTVVIFTTDHGDMMGGHGMVWKSTNAFYDEIARIPLLISYPPVLERAECDLAVDLTDLMPTILHLTGQPIPPQAQGQNLVPFLTGRRDSTEARRFAFSERVRRHPQGKREPFPGRKGDFMIRGEGFKLIRYAPGDVYLYDLRNDPGETRNLANDPRFAAQRKRLSNALDAWLDRTGWSQPG